MGHPCVRPHLRTAQDITSLSLGHVDVEAVCRESKTAWVLPSTYYWVRIDECLTAADASGAGGKKGFGPGVVSAAISNALGEGWCGAFFGTVPESECVSTAGTLRSGPVDIPRVHAYDATGCMLTTPRSSRR